jgi:dihydropteroate synthase
LRTTTLRFTDLPLLMGIVNVTPDSFSDGDQCPSIDQAVTHAIKLARDGAAIIDIGGESTRPYAHPVTAEEELRRVIPVIQQLRGKLDVPISIDTTKAVVAEAALAEGAEIINDVSGLEADPEMVALAVAAKAAVCIMHMRGTPQTMQEDPQYEDVVAEVGDYLRQRREALVAAGVEEARICLDPGIGFGKTHEHNLAILSACHRLHGMGSPLLVGHSRKGFIAKRMGSDAIDVRDAGTALLSIELARQGVQILRVHNVALHRGVFSLLSALPS